MKKLIFILLTLVFCATDITANKTSEKPKTRHHLSNSNLKNNLVKGLLGLAATSLLTYISYKCTVNDTAIDSSNLIDQADTWIHENLFLKFLDYKNNKFHQYLSCSIPLLAGIAAFESAKYTITKAKNIFEEYKLEKLEE